MIALKPLRNKALCVLLWPLLFALDAGIAWSGRRPWAQGRRDSYDALRLIWNHSYAKEHQ